MSVPNTSYINNVSTPAPPTSVGFKLSKPGYDANTASGANMIFDSSWPSLPIAVEIIVPNTITSSASPNIVIPHKLGFPPYAMAWTYGPDPGGSTLPNVGAKFAVMSNSSNVYIGANLSGSNFLNNIAMATKIKVMIFAIDLSKDIDYTLAPGATFATPYDNNYGIKMVKSGKNINSTDMRDFAIHSRCQSPLVLAVKTQDTITPLAANGGNTIQFTNKTKTPVWVYGFIKAGAAGLAVGQGVPAGTYVPAPYYNQSYPVCFTDGVTSYISWTTGGSHNDSGATLLILRDPMFSSNPITVQY